MSKNINQIYIANPITSNTSTDLMYFGQSPYGSGNDAAMTYANFAAQFSAPSPLTTKGDLYTYSTVNTRLAVGTTNGQILQVASGAATGLAWSTPTYPSASGSAGKIIVSDGTNNVYSTPTFPNASATSGKLIQSDGTNWVASTATWPTAATNGKFVIGNGTNYVESTSTIPASAGATANKVLLSDGTNYVLSTPTFPNASATAGKIIISDGTNWIASTPTYPNTSGTAGKILRSDGTNNVYTTSTFSDTYAVSTILYAGSSNAVSGLATVNSASLSTNATGVPTWLALTDGQIVIGSSAGAPLARTITAGTGISISNGNNSITINASASNWVDQTGSSVTMTTNTGYTSDDGASLVTFTLPTTSAIGDFVEINGKGSGGWTIAQATGQQIHINGSATTSGSSGSLSSTGQYDNVRLRCLTANTIWTVVSQQSAGLTVV